MCTYCSLQYHTVAHLSQVQHMSASDDAEASMISKLKQVNSIEQIADASLKQWHWLIYILFSTGVWLWVHKQAAEDVPGHRGEQGPERELQETLDKLWGTTGHRLLYPGAFAFKMWWNKSWPLTQVAFCCYTLSPDAWPPKCPIQTCVQGSVIGKLAFPAVLRLLPSRRAGALRQQVSCQNILSSQNLQIGVHNIFWRSTYQVQILVGT